MDLISAVEGMFVGLADQLGPSATLDMQKRRGVANEVWLVVALHPRSQESASIYVDVVSDEITFGIGEYGCRLHLEIGERLSSAEALRQLRQLVSAVVGGGYSEVVKEIPLAGEHVEGVLIVEQKTIQLRCGVPFGDSLPGQSSVIHYQAYERGV